MTVLPQQNSVAPITLTSDVDEFPFGVEAPLAHALDHARGM